MGLVRTNAKMTGKFWSNYQKVVETSVIPYQWKALNDELADTEPSHAISNMAIAAGVKEGEFYGMVFQDSDLYKWLESVAYSLRNHPDPELEVRADYVIDLIGKAQLEDGYINTYYQLKEGIEHRFTNLRDNHELYCAGHMIEAAVAYTEATGKEAFLNIAIKYADHIAKTFGPGEGQIKGFPGHEEIELALIRLYLATNNKKYLYTATYFVEERGKQPHYFNVEAKKREAGFKDREPKEYGYYQAHKPVREQTEAVGHAVRAVYFYTAVAELARLNQDETLKKAITRLWDNVVNKKMHINGGIGASAWGEAFGENYDLPNDTTYNETCASVGFVFWARRMLEMDTRGEYADLLENAIYNGTLCGTDLKGERFLYVNPLEINGENAGRRRDHGHVTPERQKWFNCACCPPNLARLIASVGDYFAFVRDGVIYINLYGQSEMNLVWEGASITIFQETAYPFGGDVLLTVKTDQAVRGTIALRIPGWSENTGIRINGEAFTGVMKEGYAYIDREWAEGDAVALTLDMSPRRIYANPRVTEDIGKAAITRGPLVYAAEEKDNGKDIAAIYLSDGKIEAVVNEELLPDAVYLKVRGMRLTSPEEASYSTGKPVPTPCEVTLIPYFMWGNRGYGELAVWMKEKQ